MAVFANLGGTTEATFKVGDVTISASAVSASRTQGLPDATGTVLLDTTTGDAAMLDVGTIAGTVAAGDHTHTGTYQPLDTTLTNLSGLDTDGLINLIRQPGEIQAFGHNSPAGNWLWCNGAAVSRTTYATLFAAIGTTWGAGDGSTTFNVPDLRRRTLVGSGGTSTGTLGNAVGSTGGAETHTLSTSEMPNHVHVGLGTTTVNLTSGGTGYGLGASGATQNTSSAGSGAAHNNIQPSAVVAYWIKY